MGVNPKYDSRARDRKKQLEDKKVKTKPEKSRKSVEIVSNYNSMPKVDYDNVIRETESRAYKGPKRFDPKSKAPAKIQSRDTVEKDYKARKKVFGGKNK